MTKRATIFALIVLSAINVMNYYDHNVTEAVAGAAVREFDYNARQSNSTWSALWIVVLASVPLGWIADRYSRKILLAASLLPWIALIAVAARWHSYAIFQISIYGVGLGAAVIAPAATSWIDDLAGASRRARTFAIFMLAVPFGHALVHFCNRLLGYNPSWRAEIVMAVLPAVILFPALLLSREPQRGATEDAAAMVSASSWSMLRIPTFWLIVASGVLFVCIMYTYNAVLRYLLFTFFNGARASWSATASKNSIGTMYAAGGLLGALIVWMWGDRVVRWRKDGRMLLAAAAVLVSAPFAYIGILGIRGADWPAMWALGSLTIGYGALTCYYGLAYSSILDIVSPSVRGLAMSVYFMFTVLSLVLAGPRLLEFTNLAVDNAERLNKAALIITMLSVVLTAVLWLGSRTVVRDIAKRGLAPPDAITVSLDWAPGPTAVPTLANVDRATPSPPSPSPPPYRSATQIETGPALNESVQLGNYVLERLLGEGGMGEVWMARHIHLGTPVAIKFLNRMFAGVPDIEERFRNEGRRQGGLDHPNILKVFGFEYVGDRSFLILQYVDGPSLAEVLEHGPLAPAEASRISISILNALDHAHDLNTVHRDIKPSNILLSRTGFPYLSDFGIALVTNQVRVTRTGAAMGTALYMSPEQINAPSTVDRRSDIYSFGCVMFEMLTGQPPFNPPQGSEGDTDFAIKLAHLRQQPPPLSQFVPALSPLLDNVVLKCLSKKPADRFATCREVRDALASAMVGRRFNAAPS